MRFTLLFILSISILNATYVSQADRWKRVAQPEQSATVWEIELGKMLFFDKRLSLDSSVSCASCHDPKSGWSDNRALSVGIHGKIGRRNSPTIVNSAYLTQFFYDGRANSLEDQAMGPLEDPREMGMSIDKLVERLSMIEGYRDLFKSAFGSKEINKERILSALASFERTIITPDAPFDLWVKGDENAITKAQKLGFELFVHRGRCDKCHSGFSFTNESFSNIGLEDRDDLGLYEIRKNRIWYASFKTPTLREITKTAPYFHNGSVATLKEAITICGNGGRKNATSRSPFFRDRALNQKEVEAIELFLETLVSEDIKIDIPTSFPK